MAVACAVGLSTAHDCARIALSTDLLLDGGRRHLFIATDGVPYVRNLPFIGGPAGCYPKRCTFIEDHAKVLAQHGVGVTDSNQMHVVSAVTQQARPARANQ